MTPPQNLTLPHSPDLIFLTTADARRMEAAEEFGAWTAPNTVFGVSPILK